MDLLRRSLIVSALVVYLIGFVNMVNCHLYRNPLVSTTQELWHTNMTSFVVEENAFVIMTDGQNSEGHDFHALVPLNWSGTTMPALWVTSQPWIWNLDSGDVDQESMANPWPIKVTKIRPRPQVALDIEAYSAAHRWVPSTNSFTLFEVDDSAPQCSAATTENQWKGMVFAGLWTAFALFAIFTLPIVIVFSMWYVDREKYQSLPQTGGVELAERT